MRDPVDGSQVEAAAERKFGSLEDLELHRERQRMAKVKQRIAKRRAETQQVRELTDW